MIQVDHFTIADGVTSIVVGVVEGSSLRVERVIAGPPLARLPMTNVVVRPDHPDSQAGRTGACQLVVIERRRVILFGTTSYVEHAIPLGGRFSLTSVSEEEHVRVSADGGASPTTGRARRSSQA
jgi:hypothetical protein